MTRLVLAVAVVSLASCQVPLRNAVADPFDKPSSSSFFDKNGSFAGSSSTFNNGRNTSVYDKSGRFDGSSIRNSDGTTSFYDKSGHFTGSRRDTTQPR